MKAELNQLKIFCKNKRHFSIIFKQTVLYFTWLFYGMKAGCSGNAWYERPLLDKYSHWRFLEKNIVFDIISLEKEKATKTA